MGIIEATRNLGKEIQKDERFIRFTKARLDNDKDEALQEKIGEFNTVRMNLEQEMGKEAKDENKITELNEKLRTIYSEVMSTPVMVEYNTAKVSMDELMNEVNSIIMQCVEGADPETVEPEKHNCTGSCESCGGCH